MSEIASIRSAVDALLCVSCGACAAVCPQSAVTMQETPGGLLWPTVDGDRCTECGACAAICPGLRLAPEVVAADMDPFEGHVSAVYRAQATDPALLRDAQSGGAASVLVLAALREGMIDRAVVTKWPDDGGLRPVTVATDDATDIRSARGSKYCPAPIMSTVAPILEERGRICLVGLPCHIHALRNLQHESPRHRHAAVVAIGVVCDRLLSYIAIDYLIRRSGLDASRVKAFEFRSKHWRGWPGDTYVCEGSRKERYVPREVRVACKDTFTPPACRLCFDKLNLLSDVTVGDGYGLGHDPAGVSGVLVRTEEGRRLVDCAARSGALALKPVEPRRIFDGQATEVRRREWSAYTHLWRGMGRLVPEFPIGGRWRDSIDEVRLNRLRRQLEWGVFMAKCDSRDQFIKAAYAHVCPQSL